MSEAKVIEEERMIVGLRRQWLNEIGNNGIQEKHKTD